MAMGGHHLPGRDTAVPWPLTGREEEMAFVRRCGAVGAARSVVLTGSPGVGKSRLATEVVDEVRDRTETNVLVVHVGAGLGALPFGALRAALDVETQINEIGELAAAVTSALTAAKGSNGRLLLMVDDAHLLDDQSAGLIHAMVVRGGVTVLATLRSGESTPAAVTALWKDGLADRLELQTLSRPEIAQLMGSVVGHGIEDNAVERLWQTTEGNPLYLREIVQASIETGALREVDGAWRWRRGWETASRLQEIVAERLGRLDPDELTVIEALAVGGPLPIEIISDLGPPAALGRLEARGLVTASRGSQTVVSMAHPIHVEVVRSQLPALQVRAICHNLAEAMNRLGGERPADQLRLARWSLEAGIDVHPVTLRRAADATLWHIGEAIADRIQEILPGVHGRDRPILARGPDPDAVVRLATTAWESGGGIEAGTALAIALAYNGATSQSVSVLEQVRSEVHDADDRLRLATAVAHVQFWGERRPEDAIATLREAELEDPRTTSPLLQADVLECWAGIDLNVGRAAEAEVRCLEAAHRLAMPIEQSVVAPAAASAISMLGRCQDALDLVDASMPHALAGSGHPLAPAQLLLTRCAALGRMGRFEEARKLAEICRRVSIDVDSLDGTAVYGIMIGDALLQEGKPASALRVFRDASGLLDERDALGYRPWALAGMARAKAALGDERGATESLEMTEAAWVMTRYFEPRRYLARASVKHLIGRQDEAVAALREGADWCAAAGIVVEEAMLLDSWVRIDPSGENPDRLVSLVPKCDSPLVATLARHAVALHARDPVDLMACAQDLGGMGAMLMAAGAAGAAAGIFTDRHQEREAGAAARAALSWYAHCEGARSPLLERLVAPGTLTAREMEIARLAALGQTSKDIADRLVVSIRTVDAHLYRAYAKLGVHTRGELADALAVEPGRPGAKSR